MVMEMEEEMVVVAIANKKKEEVEKGFLKIIRIII